MFADSHGYNASVGYTANFFREMAPDWMDFCVRAQGFDIARSGSAYRFLDLGCGQGFHLCLLAAANPQAEFVGIDFQSDHIAHARELAVAGGIDNVTFVEADFLNLAAEWPNDLGCFDYIILQGILSWVSPALRSAAIHSVDLASKPGTLAAFGYNGQPGWLQATPFQHIANRFGKGMDSSAALSASFHAFREIRSANSPFYDLLPYFNPHLDLLATQPVNYLAHEFLTDNWTPLWHSTVAEELRGANFSFVGSATIAEAMLPAALPPPLQTLLLEQTDDLLRQDLQDIIIVQPFRRDIFCREPRRLDPPANLDLDAPIYLASTPPAGVPLPLNTAYGTLNVDYRGIADLVSALADGPRTVGDLMALKNPIRANTRAILLYLLHAHVLMPGKARPESPRTAEDFNAVLAKFAADGTIYPNVAAAALGSGPAVTELELLLLDAWFAAERDAEPSLLCNGLAQRLNALGRKVTKDGSPIPDGQAQDHLTKLAQAFANEVIPRWRSLGAIA